MASRAFSDIMFFSLYLYIIYVHLSESSEIVSTPKNFTNKENKNTIDKCLELALKKYKKNYRPKITGILDSITAKTMRRPRCAMPDIYPTKRKTTAFYEHYGFMTDRPPLTKDKLTYAFKGMKKETTHAIERALRQWEAATHFKFTRATFYWRADIRFSFKPSDHDDCYLPFEGDLAHSLPDGRIHFNAMDRWSVSQGSCAGDAYDLETVALHEIGHTLGLEHTDVMEAIMFEAIGAGETRGLHRDDIDGIKALYDK